MNARGGPLAVALLCCACVGRPQAAVCVTDDDCGAGSACFAGACFEGARTAGGIGWCPTLRPSLSEIDRSFLKLSCGSSATGCHTHADAVGPNATSGLDLSGDAYSVLVNVPAALLRASMPHGILRVDPGHPDSSFLVIKLRQTGYDPSTGSGMPPDHPGETCDTAKAAIEAWIAQGAPRN